MHALYPQFCRQLGSSKRSKMIPLSTHPLPCCPGWTETEVLSITAANTAAALMQSDPVSCQQVLSPDRFYYGNSWLDHAKRSSRFDKFSFLWCQMTLSASQGDFIAGVSMGTSTTCLEGSPQAREVLWCSETIFTELKSSNEIFIGH